jgi:hypothetical protein
MPQLKKIVVAHTTATESKAASNAQFMLQIQKPNPPNFTMAFPDLPHDERQKGRLDLYEFDLEGKNISTEDPGFDILMTIKSGNPGDEWLPASICVLGQTSDNEIFVLGDFSQWPSDQWFDKTTGHPTHEISNTT